MKFIRMSAEEYRALDYDGIVARRAEILAEFDNAASEVSTEELVEESRACQAEIDRRNRANELRMADIHAVCSGNGNVVTRTAEPVAKGDALDTAEYRNAFMEYVCRGTAIPAELRASTMTSDVSPMVPTTMGREIVKEMSKYGDIWPKVRKLNVQGGIWFRVLDLKPTATWIDEDKTSEYQKVAASEKVSFSFYELECRMSQSLLASAVTFEDFQAMFVPAVAEAMVRALEQAIIRGNGTNQPLGILNDPRVTKVVELSPEDFADWKKWHSKVLKAVPTSYRGGEFIMAQATFDSYIDTMSDDHNAPVSIGYDPVTGTAVKRLVGHQVATVETDILPDFEAAGVGEVVAIYGKLTDYVVNTQPKMPMTTVRWIDHDNNQEKIKALTALDGKVLDPHGFLLIKKAAGASA